MRLFYFCLPACLCPTKPKLACAVWKVAESRIAGSSAFGARNRSGLRPGFFKKEFLSGEPSARNFWILKATRGVWDTRGGVLGGILLMCVSPSHIQDIFSYIGYISTHITFSYIGCLHILIYICHYIMYIRYDNLRGRI